jgi:hypothetical protein
LTATSQTIHCWAHPGTKQSGTMCCSKRGDSGCQASLSKFSDFPWKLHHRRRCRLAHSRCSRRHVRFHRLRRGGGSLPRTRSRSTRAWRHRRIRRRPPVHCRTNRGCGSCTRCDSHKRKCSRYFMSASSVNSTRARNVSVTPTMIAAATSTKASTSTSSI